ncbi:hypothetical protein P9112_008562 [Eukaryota sp. TZLM1-RC]
MESLLSTLQQQGHVSLITSLCGTHYFTGSGLVSTIKTFLMEHSGRASVLDIAAHCNLPTDTISTSISTHFSKSDYSLFRGTLTHSSYWSAFFDQLFLALNNQGFVNLVDIAKEHLLPLEQLMNQFSNYSQLFSQCLVCGHYIWSNWLVSGVCDDVKAVLSQQSSEVNVFDLLDEDRLPRQLVSQVIDRIGEEVKGSINFDGNQVSYVPDSVINQQKSEEVNKIQREGFYLFESKSKCLKFSEIEGKKFLNCFITNTYYEFLLSLFGLEPETEMIDLIDYLPFNDDVMALVSGELLSDLGEMSQQYLLVSSSLFMSRSFYESIMKKIEDFLEPKVQNYVFSLDFSGKSDQKPNKKSKKGKKSKQLNNSPSLGQKPPGISLTDLNSLLPNEFSQSEVIYTFLEPKIEDLVKQMIQKLLVPSREAFQSQLTSLEVRFFDLYTEIDVYLASLNQFKAIFSEDYLGSIIDLFTAHFVKTRCNFLCQLVKVLVDTFSRFESELPLPPIKFDEVNLGQSINFLTDVSPKDTCLPIDMLIRAVQSNDLAGVFGILPEVCSNFGLCLKNVKKEDQNKCIRSKKIDLQNAFKKANSPPEMFHLLLESLLSSIESEFPIVIAVPPKSIPRTSELLENYFNISNFKGLCSRITSYLTSKTKPDQSEIDCLKSEICEVYSNFVIVSQ